MVLFLFAAFISFPALADVTFPAWGNYYYDGSNYRGLFYKVERVETPPHVQFEVEMRSMTCVLAAVQNPHCSFDYADISYANKSKTVVRKTSKYNSLQCKTAKYTTLAFVSKPIHLWDSFGDFSKEIISGTTNTETMNGEVLRAGERSFVDASCVTFETPAGTN